MSRPNLLHTHVQAPAPDHYENFPVASILMPRRLRRATRAIYWFARSADDMADEGSALPAERLAGLNRYRDELAMLAAGQPSTNPLFIVLADVVREHKLPLQPFYDLLDAFSQDVEKNRYANFAEVMAYCRKSANPVGRLMLALYEVNDERSLAYSDAICSALQIINFLQDVAIDYQKDRIYLPQDELQRYRISEARIARGDASGTWSSFMQLQIERARKLLQAGAPLGLQLRGRIGLEMRLIIMGGSRILEQLHNQHGDMFNHRPKLGPRDWLVMGYRALARK